MDRRTCNTFLVCGIAAGLFSLPMTWMSVRLDLMGGLPGMLSAMAGGMRQSVNVTGLTGSVTILTSLPFWSFIVLGVSAALLQFMANSKLFSVPAVMEGGLAFLAPLGFIVSMMVGLTSGQATPALGLLFALVCVGMPLFCILFGTDEVTSPAQSESPKHVRPPQCDESIRPY